MKHRIAFINLSLLAVFLVLASTAALASNTWYVDGVHGKNKNDCKSPQTPCKTIGHAISLAHPGDSIMVAAATYTENLTIKFNLKMIGSGSSTTIIDGNLVKTVVAISSANAHVTLSKLTIQDGYADAGGGIYNVGTLVLTNTAVSQNLARFVSKEPEGGGIYNGGTLTIKNSTVSGNTAVDDAQTGRGHGGGIYNTGTLTISNSTFSGNVAAGGQGNVSPSSAGGGIDNVAGVLRISHSTFSGNVASGPGNRFFPTAGGGIYSDGTLIIWNSTFSGNSARAVHYGSPTLGGGIYFHSTGFAISNNTFSGNSANFGGGISGTASLQNTIVANSTSDGNCDGTVTSNGYNLSSDDTCNFNNTGDLNNTDPKLGALKNNGGPTQTQALLSGSPAIDAGNPSGCTDGRGHLLKTDQRGKPRPDKQSGRCDMGAYERQKDWLN